MSPYAVLNAELDYRRSYVYLYEEHKSVMGAIKEEKIFRVEETKEITTVIIDLLPFCRAT